MIIEVRYRISIVYSQRTSPSNLLRNLAEANVQYLRICLVAQVFQVADRLESLSYILPKNYFVSFCLSGIEVPAQHLEAARAGSTS